MANKLDEMIEAYLIMHGGEEDENVLALSAKSKELGADASEKECVKAAISAVGARLACLLSRITTIKEEEIVLSEEEQENLEEAVRVVQEFLDEEELRYDMKEIREDVVLFDFGITARSNRFRMKITVEEQPSVCRISAVFPFAADAVYEYPLCKLLKERGYFLRFGDFKYDESDGELSFVYSFLTLSGIRKEELGIYFHSVIEAVVENYADIRKCCSGCFKSKEVKDIIEKAENLVKDIS